MRDYPDYYYEQSAVIPYRWLNDQLQILVITSRSRRRWVVPKGIVEPFMSPASSAAKEAMEEAGVSGLVHERPIGQYQYPKWGDVCTCQVFVMRVEEIRDAWRESHRLREWLAPTDAASRLRDVSLKQMVADLSQFLQSNPLPEG